MEGGERGRTSSLESRSGEAMVGIVGLGYCGGVQLGWSWVAMESMVVVEVRF